MDIVKISRSHLAKDSSMGKELLDKIFFLISASFSEA